MTPNELGQVFNQLVEHRVLYTFAAKGHSRSQGEREAAACLERHLDYHDELDVFLSTQGLRLMSYEAAALDIGVAGRVYVAVRDPALPTPAHIGGGNLLREMSDSRRNETAAEATLWAGLLTVVLMQLLYSDTGRPIEAVSGFATAELDEGQFVQTLLAAIERQRHRAVDPDDSEAERAQALFTGANESQIEARAKGFLRAMIRGGVIEVRAEGKTGTIFGQTLWSAVDIAENFKRYGGGLLPQPTSDEVAAMVSSASTVIREV
jgi:hypothetical protein